MKKNVSLTIALLLSVPTLCVLLMCAQRVTDPIDTDTKEEFQLKGSFSGTVLSDAGAPVMGVAVTVDSAGYSSTTDSLGRFTIPDIRSGTWRISFAHPHYADTTLVSAITLVVDQEIVGVTMALKRIPQYFPSTLTGTLTGINGSPLSGATITVDSTGTTTVTDSSGTYVLTPVLAGVHSLYISHPAYGDTVIRNVAVSIDTAFALELLALEPNPGYFPGTIAGTIVDSTGAPVAGVAVVIDSAGYTGQTDSLGRYQLNGVIAGTYTLRFSKSGYLPASQADVVVQMMLLTTVPAVQINASVGENRGSIAGRITDDLGAPVSGATVGISAEGVVAISDSQGNYILTEVIAGTHTVSFAHTSYFDTSRVSIAVNLAEAVTGVDAVMRRKSSAFPGFIAGMVMDSVTRTPLRGVTVATTPASQTAVSNELGEYVIDNAPFGMYGVRTSGTYRSNLVTGIVVEPADTARADTLWAARNDVLLRDVTGPLDGMTSLVDHITATVTGDLISPQSPQVVNLTWLSISKTYTGAVSLPQQGLVWSVAVRVYDTLDRVIGYQTIDFDRGAASVTLPKFDVRNATPQLVAGSDTTVSINDTVYLHASVVDSFTAGGMRPDPLATDSLVIEWSINGAAFNVVGADTVIVAPSTAIAPLRCIGRVTDEDGNVRLDTTDVTVETDLPSVTAGNDTTVSINDLVKLHAVASDLFGTVESISWDIGGTGVFKEGSSDTQFTAKGTPDKSFLCIVRATDNDGGSSFDTTVVTIVLDAPVANAGNDTSVNMGALVTLRGSASQQFGSIVKWEWAIDGGPFKTVGNPDTTITVPDWYVPGYVCRLRATDDDGNEDIDTVLLTVGYQWTVMGTAGISTNAAVGIQIGSSPMLRNKIYVVYANGAGGGPVYSRQWSSGNWTAQGTALTTYPCTRTDIGFTHGKGGGGGVGLVDYEIPNVAFFETATDSARVRASSLVVGGKGLYVPGDAYGPINGLEMEIKGSNALIATIDNTTNRYVRVHQGSTSTAWSQVGGYVASNAHSISFSIDHYASPTDPHIAVITGDESPHTVTVRKYNGSSWDLVGNPWTTGSDGYNVGITMNEDRAEIVMTRDTAFVAYIDPIASDKLSVRKFDGSSWVQVGQQGISEGPVRDIAMAADQGELYVAYLDRDLNDRITVKHWDGVVWRTVGSRGFSAQSCKYVSLAVEKTKTKRQPELYVAFSDASVSYALTVMKLQ